MKKTLEDFVDGDRVRVNANIPADFVEDVSELIGKCGTVLYKTRMHVEVKVDGEDYPTLFLPDELDHAGDETVEPEPVVEEGRTPDVAYDDLADYGIRIREFGDAFEYFHKPSGKVLIVTQFISMDTLVRIATDHMDGNR